METLVVAPAAPGADTHAGPGADTQVRPYRSAWPAWRAALFAFTVSRFVVLLSAWLGLWQLIGLEPARNKGLLVEGALMWDGAWYWRVLTHGYYINDPQTGSDLAFCPLFPLLLRGLTGLLDAIGMHIGDPVYGNYVLLGLLVSNVSFLLALVLLWHLVRADAPAAVADRTLLLIAVFPTALFWSAIYTESLFFLLVVGVFWLVRREHWALACAVAALAGVTRWPGLLLGPVILLAFVWRPAVPAGCSGGARLRAALCPALGWLVLVPLPFLAYLAYLAATFGNPLIVMAVEHQGWGHSTTFFPQVWLDSAGMLIASWRTTTPGTDPVLALGAGQRLWFYQDLGFTALFAGLAVWAGWRRLLRPPELAWLALGVIFPLSLGTTMGIARYLLPLWPGFLLLARGLGRRPRLEQGWLLASTGLLAATTVLWASGHWMD